MSLRLPPALPDAEITRLVDADFAKWTLFEKQVELYSEDKIDWSDLDWEPGNHTRPMYELLEDDLFCDETPEGFCANNCEGDSQGFELRESSAEEERLWIRFFEKLRNEPVEEVDKAQELVLV